MTPKSAVHRFMASHYSRGRALGLLLLVGTAGCERPCSLGPIDVCTRLELTCDLDRGVCVEFSPCQSNAECSGHLACRTQAGLMEGVVHNGLFGCPRNCIPIDEGEVEFPDRSCDQGYVCDATTRRCVLDTTRQCRPGGFTECHGANCSPTGTCVAPNRCKTNAECTDGFLCETSTGTCYASCSVSSQCASTSSCDVAAKRCVR